MAVTALLPEPEPEPNRRKDATTGAPTPPVPRLPPSDSGVVNEQEGSAVPINSQSLVKPAFNDLQSPVSSALDVCVSRNCLFPFLDYSSLFGDLFLLDL